MRRRVRQRGIPACAAAAQRERPPLTEILAFYHLACFPGWQAIFQEQLADFERASITPRAFVLGSESDVQDANRYLPVASQNPSLALYETPTLHSLWREAHANPTAAILYCHSKGVSQPQDSGKAVWRRLMAEKLVRPVRELASFLSDVDAVGVSYCENRLGRYFPGNFWLARADYIAGLPDPWQHRRGTPTGGLRPWDRMAAEHWLFANGGCAVRSLCGTNQVLWRKDVCERLLDTDFKLA
jgi:hypothetical protein